MSETDRRPQAVIGGELAVTVTFEVLEGPTPSQGFGSFDDGIVISYRDPDDGPDGEQNQMVLDHYAAAELLAKMLKAYRSVGENGAPYIRVPGTLRHSAEVERIKADTVL